MPHAAIPVPSHDALGPVVPGERGAGLPLDQLASGLLDKGTASHTVRLKGL